MQRVEDILLSKGLLEKAQLDEAQALARDTHTPLPTVLMARGLLSEAQILQVQAERYGLEFVRLDKVTVESAAVKAVPAKLAAHYTIVPVSLRGNTLTIAVSDPVDMATADDLEANLGCEVERVLACRSDIEAVLAREYGVGAETVEKILAANPRTNDTGTLEVAHDLAAGDDDASVVRLVNQLVQDAIRDRATDIHFEVSRDDVSVRRRIDGVLYDTSVPPSMKSLYPAIVSRVKLMSNLNIVERRMPQDGRARVSIGDMQYDLRVSVVPSIHGEDIVIRILPATMLFDLEHLGFSESHLEMLKSMVTQPHGIIFVTGPTGSGKSTTLYACLSQLNSRERKIITIEDPVEYELKGITQTQINPKIGLSFARALRSMLRHDPDVMMVGEVRDSETADIAIQTAMTGHLVLSTLHTNDAAGSAIRLTDMGVDPYLIASTVQVFVAQRLVRVICKGCKEEYQQDDQTLYRGKGCEACKMSGYAGRVAISEMLPMVPDIQELVLKHSSAAEIRRKADALGMASLARDGWEKVAAGITTPEELLRVTS